MTALPPPSLIRDGAVFRSDTFDDIYYQPEDGLAETQHVFVNGNDLPDRFARLEAGDHFVIGELGFGTGLNLLCTMEAFAAAAKRGAQLHYVAGEGFPLSQSQAREALSAIAARWPALKPHADALGTAYPPPRPGLAQLWLSPNVTLTLSFGPVTEALADLDGQVDAWFLDGFSPAKNPDMWAPEVLARVGDLTRPGGTFATFTVAGAVRRALADARFSPEKAPGFGKKRDMLRGQKLSGRPADRSPEHIAIIGAGIAGAALAHQLTRLGRKVTIVEANAPGAGASGNPIGLLMPRIDAQDTPAARFYRDAFLFAHRFYAAAVPNAIDIYGGELEAVSGTPDRFEKALSNGLWDAEDLRLQDTGSAFVPSGATLRPGEAIAHLIDGLVMVEQAVLQVREQTDGVILVMADGSEVAADIAVWTNGAALSAHQAFEGDVIPSRGQLDLFAAPRPGRIKTRGHYVAPYGEGLAVGATYDPWALEDEVTTSADSLEANREAALSLLGETPINHLRGRASLRATTKDRHPVAGPLPASPGKEAGDYRAKQWGIGGLGSRGLSTGPFLAAHLAQIFVGGISPLSPAGQKLIEPSRFAARRARRASS